MLIIKKYQTEDSRQWDDFILSSRNGTFLFLRQYMDYHSDRFCDFSIMIYDPKGKLIAVIPANKIEDVFYTHQGLTFGGIISQSGITTQVLLQIGESVNNFLKDLGLRTVVFKKIPYIYGKQPIDEEKYLLFRNHAKMIACNISTTIALQEEFVFHRSRKSAINKSKKQELVINKNISWKAFWDILEQNLKQKFGAKPVHSFEEITRLQSIFQNNIHLFTAERYGVCLGGIVIYESDMVAHAQYISVNEEGKDRCALDFILDYLINHEFKHKKYFDLGSSTEQNGQFLNESLIFQKEGFGGRGVCYETFEYDL